MVDMIARCETRALRPRSRCLRLNSVYCKRVLTPSPISWFSGLRNVGAFLNLETGESPRTTPSPIWTTGRLVQFKMIHVCQRPRSCQLYWRPLNSIITCLYSTMAVTCRAGWTSHSTEPSATPKEADCVRQVYGPCAMIGPYTGPVQWWSGARCPVPGVQFVLSDVSSGSYGPDLIFPS